MPTHAQDALEAELEIARSKKKAGKVPAHARAGTQPHASLNRQPESCPIAGARTARLLVPKPALLLSLTGADFRGKRYWGIGMLQRMACLVLITDVLRFWVGTEC